MSQSTFYFNINDSYQDEADEQLVPEDRTLGDPDWQMAVWLSVVFVGVATAITMLLLLVIQALAVALLLPLWMTIVVAVELTILHRYYWHDQTPPA